MNDVVNKEQKTQKDVGENESAIVLIELNEAESRIYASVK